MQKTVETKVGEIRMVEAERRRKEERRTRRRRKNQKIKR